jgi:hypothetical protein
MPSIFRLSLILLFLNIALFTMGQQQALLIKVVDVKNNPVGFANITIQSKVDSTKTTNAITDSIGITKVNLNAKNAFIFKISAIGYKKFSKDYFIN